MASPPLIVVGSGIDSSADRMWALAQFGRISDAVRMFHPSLGGQEWDDAESAAIERLMQGESLPDVIADALVCLGDPATGVSEVPLVTPDPTAMPGTGPGPAQPAVRVIDDVPILDGTVLVGIQATPELGPQLHRAFEAIGPTERLVVDLRKAGPHLVWPVMARIAGILATTWSVPGLRGRFHGGGPGVVAKAGWATLGAPGYPTSAGTGGLRHIAFVLDAESEALTAVVGLRQAIGARFVAHGMPSPSATPPIRFALEPSETAR